MNTIEEKLWNYIDGTCSPAEQDAIAMLIEQDEVYAQKYQELLALNQEFAKMELDEPPMAFTYNVMEAIRTENAMQPLKANIDKRIILGIAIFFVFTILTLLTFIFANIHISGININAADIKLPAGVKLPSTNSLVSGPVLKWFLIFDVVLALFLTDAYLRRKKTASHL
ncbi:anti-sigma factor [Mucilaginibacter sp. RCC_168]|uniref:anti-sigma factor family protein n=1 Tax=Mucilaginibacter sp. RCC_168 TaxID=3239221 RepID=UPI0035262303